MKDVADVTMKSLSVRSGIEEVGPEKIEDAMIVGVMIEDVKIDEEMKGLDIALIVEIANDMRKDLDLHLLVPNHLPQVAHLVLHLKSQVT